MTHERDVRAPQPTLLRRVAFGATLFVLVTVPLLLAVTGLSHALTPNRDWVAIVGFPIWASFSVWVTLDAATLFRLVGIRPDPLGPQSLKLSALGLINLIAIFLFVILASKK